MKPEEIKTPEETTVEIFCERLEQKGSCLKPLCGTPKDELIEGEVFCDETNGNVESLTCPQCGSIHTKDWYELKFADPDKIRKETLEGWTMN